MNFDRVVLLAFLASTANAFNPTFSYQQQPTAVATTSTQQPRQLMQQRPSSFSLRMSDFDFPSAMPEKPQLTMEEKIQESADATIEMMYNTLGEGVEPPPELEALKKARENGGTSNELSVLIYDVMIERGMLYDEAPETGTLTPTEFNIKENLEVPEVKEEFKYLYTYGMKLMNTGLLTREQVEKSVIERLINRTGLTPEEFDKWLGF